MHREGEGATGLLSPAWVLPTSASGEKGSPMELVHLVLLACRGRQEHSYWLWARSMFGRPRRRGQEVGPQVGSFPA